MIKNKDSVIVIGQFPPPVSGFSYITGCMADTFREDCEVTTLDIKSAVGLQGIRKHLSRISSVVNAAHRMLRSDTKESTCYIACEGGLGLIYTIALIIISRIYNRSILLHHHSFYYIDKASIFMYLLLAIGGPIRHVFLCSSMKNRFEQRYNKEVASLILSNSAFVRPLPYCETAEPRLPLVLGHLSNLTREKGLGLFLDLLRQAVSEGRDVHGILAGPAAVEADRLAIEEARILLGERLDYRGPIYGKDKDRFYRDIDVFVFPTQYVNEAQPTVLFEALAAGCKVLSFNRGCIPDQVQNDGLVLPKSADFVNAALHWIDGAGTLAREDRLATVQRYKTTHEAALETARSLLKAKGQHSA